MTSLTITSVQCIPMRLPFHHWTSAPLFAGKPRTTLDSALVRVETATGIVGWGESYCIDAVALKSVFENLVAPLTVGKSADDPSLAIYLQRTLHNLGRSGPVQHALAGLDIALWDIKGKVEGVPIYELLGGKKRDQIPAYASLLQYYADPDLISRNVTRALEEGYREIKLHERTSIALGAARRAMEKDMPLMLDTNCAWLPSEAAAAIEEMLPYEPFWIEEPIWSPDDTDALLQLRENTTAKIAVGENASSLQQLLTRIERNAVDYIQPSVIKLGLSASWQVAQATVGTSTTFAPQVAFFGPGYLASLHMLAASECQSSLERLYVDLKQTPYATTVPILNGSVYIPDAPGLGADPDFAFASGEFSN